jgi:hypothetical protein
MGDPFTSKNRDFEIGLFARTAMVSSHNQNFMTSEPILAHAHTMPLQNSAASILWTDDHASLFRVLRP